MTQKNQFNGKYEMIKLKKGNMKKRKTRRDIIWNELMEYSVKM